MELLERVVGQHRGVYLFGHSQQEGVPSPDGSGRGVHVLAPHGSLLEAGKFRRIDAVGEGCIDDDGDLGVGVVSPQLGDGLLELAQTGQGTALSRDVGPVHDDVLDWHVLVVKHPGPASAGNAAYRPLQEVLVLQLMDGGRARRGAAGLARLTCLSWYRAPKMACRRPCANDQAPMFSGSSWSQTTSLAWG